MRKLKTTSDIKTEKPLVNFTKTENQMPKNEKSANRNEIENRKLAKTFNPKIPMPPSLLSFVWRRHVRGIEWSLRAAHLFLRARAVIKYVLRAANTDGEQQALRKFSRRNLDFPLLKRNVFCHAIWLTPLNQ